MVLQNGMGTWAGQHPSVSDRLYSNNPHQGVILAFKPHPSDNGTRQITATYCLRPLDTTLISPHPQQVYLPW